MLSVCVGLLKSPQNPSKENVFQNLHSPKVMYAEWVVDERRGTASKPQQICKSKQNQPTDADTRHSLCWSRGKNVRVLDCGVVWQFVKRLVHTARPFVRPYLSFVLRSPPQIIYTFFNGQTPACALYTLNCVGWFISVASSVFLQIIIEY